MVYGTITTGRTRNVAETRSVIAAFVEASESVAGGVAAACVPDLNNGPTLQGRALARNGAVTNDEPS